MHACRSTLEDPTDLHLASGSPCIDRADDAAPPLDLEGVTRPLDGDGDQVPLPDIGAYEAPAVASRLELRRPLLTAIVPPTPPVRTLLPADPATVILPAFRSGDADPESGILTRVSAPLALYQVVDAPLRTVLAVKDVAGQTVRVSLR